MTSAEAKLCIGLPVKITAHQGWGHYATGRLISVEGNSAIVRGRFFRSNRDESEQRFHVRYVRRWPAGETAQAARLNTLAVASAAAEYQGMALVKAAGLPVKRGRGVVPAEKFYAKADELGAGAIMGPNGGEIHVKFTSNGVCPAPDGLKITHPEICPEHGHDMPCEACAAPAPPAAPPAPAGASEPAGEPAAAPVPPPPPADKVEECGGEIVPLGDAARHLVVDTKSGRIWGGASYGFMDASKDPTTAIRYARGLHAVDARKYVSLLKKQNKRPGQYWRDGLHVMTEAQAMDLLTEPGRVFTPPPTPLDEQTGDAQEFGRAMAELAGEMQAAARAVARFEDQARKLRAAAEAAEEAARRAREDAERAEREAREARERAGAVKARMAALIESQGF